MKPEQTKYTVEISDRIEDFDPEDPYTSPQYFHFDTDDKMLEFVKEMVTVHDGHSDQREVVLPVVLLCVV